MEMLDLTFQVINETDIPEVTLIMKRAFDDDTQKYLGKESGGQPGYDYGEFFRTWLLPYQDFCIDGLLDLRGNIFP